MINPVETVSLQPKLFTIVSLGLIPFRRVFLCIDLSIISSIVGIYSYKRDPNDSAVAKF